MIHWLDANAAMPAEVRNFERLFDAPAPGGDDFTDDLNPNSLRVDQGYVEPAIVQSPESRFQFERTGYFVKDSEDHRADRPVFNRIVSLRDSWKPKAQGK